MPHLRHCREAAFQGVQNTTLSGVLQHPWNQLRHQHTGCEDEPFPIKREKEEFHIVILRDCRKKNYRTAQAPFKAVSARVPIEPVLWHSTEWNAARKAQAQKQWIHQRRNLPAAGRLQGFSYCIPTQIHHNCTKTCASTSQRQEKRLGKVMSFQPKQQDSQKVRSGLQSQWKCY